MKQPLKKLNKLSEELQAYRNSDWSCNEKSVIQKHRPLLFFKQNHQQFPILSRLAKAIFSASPASTPVECLFSGAKETANPLRNRANPQQVENLTFLRRNKH